MKEVKKCSISGVAFTLDADAYDELSAYFDTLKTNYTEDPDGAEIIADIEARIAELILSEQDNVRVVEKPLIERIIRQMGSAEEISVEEEPAPHAAEPRIPRRLYRDTEHAKLGGVCAGLGKFTDTDPAWMRLGFFALLILMFVGFLPFMHWMRNIMGDLFLLFVLCYIIMWFVVPAARSARQKLEMSGEKITTQSIRKKTATTAGNDADSRAKPIVATTVSTFGTLVLILLKIFAGLIVFGLVMAASALIIGLFAVLFGAGVMSQIFITASLWIPALWILVCLVPLLLLIYVLMCLIASHKPGGKTILITFIVWLLICIAAVSVSIRTNTYPTDFRWPRHKVEHMRDDTPIIIDGDTTTMRQLMRKDYPHSSNDYDADDDTDTNVGVNINAATEDGAANIRITPDSIHFKAGKVSVSASVNDLEKLDSLFD